MTANHRPMVRLLVWALLPAALCVAPATASSGATAGSIHGQLVVAGREDKGEVSTFVFLVPSTAKQPISLSEAAKTAQQLEDPSGRFEFVGVEDGEYLVAVENELLAFTETYDSVSVTVGSRVATVAAIRVRVTNGIQDRQVLFKVTPESASNNFPSITSPRTGDGGMPPASAEAGQQRSVAGDLSSQAHRRRPDAVLFLGLGALALASALATGALVNLTRKAHRP
jgi:hypothetical protein